MKVVKRLLAGALCAFMLCNMTTVAFADNPLQLSDRLTQRAQQEQQRQTDIRNARSAQQGTQAAYHRYGINSNDTDNFSFYINRKYLTKKEFEAFKWSFIFSQFARPLQDSLIDVFSQWSGFEEMVEQKFHIESVSSALQNGSINPSTDKIYEAMLSDTNFDDLVSTIEKNFCTYALHDGLGKVLKFGDLLSAGSSIPLMQKYYIYDTRWDPGTESVDCLNALLYNQQIVGDANVENAIMHGSVTAEEVPVFAYTAQSALYVQLAVAGFLMTNGDISTVEELSITYGNDTMVIDSYGNVCAMHQGVPTIVIPNFGNAYLTAKISGENANSVNTDLEESINFFNGWITAFYSRNTRPEQTIYPKNSGFALALASKGDVYSGAIGVPRNGSLAPSILLVEPSDVYPSQLLVGAALDDSTSQSSGGGSLDMPGTGDMLGNFNEAMGVEDDQDDEDTNLWNKLSKWLNGSITPTDYRSLENTIGGIRSHTAYEFSHAAHNVHGTDMVGTLTSPMHGEYKYFAPFTATGASAAEKAVYENEIPLIIPNVDVGSLDGTDTNAATNFRKVVSSIRSRKWSYVYGAKTEEFPYAYAVHNVTASISNSFWWWYDYTAALNMADLAMLEMAFKEGQLIYDPRFISDQYSFSNGEARAVLTLPDAILDLGQYMDAYIDDEKGMLLASYRRFFSGDGKALHDYAETFASVLELNTQYSYSNGKIGLINNKKVNNPFKDFLEVAKINDSTPYGVFIEWNDKMFYNHNFWNYIEEHSYCSCNNAKHSGAPGFGHIYYYHKVDDEGNVESGWTRSNTLPAVGRYTGAQKFSYPVSLPLHIAGEDSKFFSVGITSTVNGEESAGSPPSSLEGLIATNGVTTNQKATVVIRAISDVFYHAADSESTLTAAEYLGHIQTACTLAGLNYEDMITAFSVFAKYNSPDGNANALNNRYMYDEYWYYLRNINNLSSVVGCSNSDTFASTIYYWDRYYLTNTAFNKQLTELVLKQWGTESESGTIANIIADYENYLFQNNLSKLECSLETFVEHSSKYNQNKTGAFGNYNLYTPFYYEYQYQNGTFEEYKTKFDPDYNKFDDATILYQYLDGDTILLYPFTSDNLESTITLYTGIGDGLLLKESPDDIDTSKGMIQDFSRQCYSPIQLILSLQKNTDYTRNTLNETFKRSPTTNTVTKEQLMDKANQFFVNPVTSISYIITGFLYRIHDAIATGSLGNVFSISWLLETDIYQWIINRYVALMSIALIVLLLLKLTQLAMSRTHNFSTISRSVAGILAMGIVPVVLFNSFVWAFDTTSSWALGDSYDKVLLSQVERKAIVLNQDAAVDAELSAFKEQFQNLSGNYDCATFDILSSYNYSNGPTYKEVSLDTMLERLRYKTTFNSWYTGEGMQAVHAKFYDESLFYYFYDYIRSSYFGYCQSHREQQSLSGAATFISELGKAVSGASPDDWKSNVDFQKKIMDLEDGFKSIPGGGVYYMLQDMNYVYGASIDETQKDKYDGPQVKDLVGLYNIFRAEGQSSGSSELDAVLDRNIYLRAYKDHADMLVSEDGVVPRTWLDTDILEEYAEKNFISKNMKGEVTSITRTATSGVYPVFTSRLDAFDTKLNPAAGSVYAEYTGIPLTPLEEKLCNLTDDIYETSLKCLSYLTSDIHDESAIIMMAYIATFKTNEAFGLEPAGPIVGTVNLDSIVRAAFVTDLSQITSETNTLYAMVQQGDSIGKIALVVVLELIICIASVARVFIVLYITGASFVILALRIMNKTPKTSDLVYGIVGNLLALLFLHALTLFLVVIAIEWVASATSAIPGLILDVAMILFIVAMSALLFKLVKNIILDAINIGGAKIKGIIHSITDAVVNATGKLFNQGEETVTASNVNIRGDRVLDELESSRAARRNQAREARSRTEAMIQGIEQAEALADAMAGVAPVAGHPEVAAAVAGVTAKASRVVGQAEAEAQQLADAVGELRTAQEIVTNSRNSRVERTLREESTISSQTDNTN